MLSSHPYFNESPLAFIEPKTARIKERNAGEELLFPQYPDSLNLWALKRPQKSPTTYRNIIAWYLKAAGLTGKEIGSFLSISASRANQLALRTRKQVGHIPWGITDMQTLAKSANVDGQYLAAHLLRGTRHDMITAEFCLDRCIDQDPFVVSGALRLGRAAYASAYEKLAGIVCPCRWCTGPGMEPSLAPYWK